MTQPSLLPHFDFENTFCYKASTSTALLKTAEQPKGKDMSARSLNAFGTVVAILLAGWANGAFAAPIQVQVYYQSRPCASSSKLMALTPVTAGTVMLRRGNDQPVLVTLSETPAKVSLDGTGPLNATLVLETPRIKVVQAPGGGTAEWISLGAGIESDTGVTFSLGGLRDQDNGHINVLLQLEKAAKIAEQASPAKLAQVTATVYDGLVGGRPTTHFDTPDKIDVGQANGVDAQWEADTLNHEYGHFVLHSVAPGGPAGDAHEIGQSYPDKPDIAWTEGFPAAFAAVVNEGGGYLQLNCGPYQHLGQKPARPKLVSETAERYSQYNESRVGAITYQLIEYLGKGAVGLARLLDAMTQYKRDGHNVWTARDLRDLAVQQFETSAADHAALDEIFTGQQVSWGERFGVGLAAVDANLRADIVLSDLKKIRVADPEIALSIVGPGGFDCHVNSDVNMPSLVQLDGGHGVAMGRKTAEGGLSYSANDDCYMVSGDGKVPDRVAYHGLGTDMAEIPFPYLAGLAHWQGLYFLKARFVCEFDQGLGMRFQFHCPDTFHVVVSVFNLSLMLHNKGPASDIVELHRNVDQTVATFTADGKCTILGSAGAIDCGF
jgi:hypothetical protein